MIIESKAQQKGIVVERKAPEMLFPSRMPVCFGGSLLDAIDAEEVRVTVLETTEVETVAADDVVTEGGPLIYQLLSLRQVPTATSL